MGRVRVTAIRKRSPAALSTAKAVLYKKTVKESTNKTYASHLKTIEKILAQMRRTRSADALSITKEELLELLVNLEEQGCASGPGFVSALRKHALCLSVKIDHLKDPAVDAAAMARTSSMTTSVNFWTEPSMFSYRRKGSSSAVV
jgi:hypothetical protein